MSERVPVLVVTTGPEAGRVVQLPSNESVVVGRSSDCTIQIADDGLSRRHARLAHVLGQFVIADLVSSNGTFVNQVPVRDPVTLKDGDRIRLGPNTAMWFALADDSEREGLRRAYDGSLRDVVTGLFNRRAFEESLLSAVAYANRRDDELSVLFADVDHFKAINDTFGHPAGDEALRFVATVFVSQTRADDTLSRIGGDEFAIVARSTNLHEAGLLAARLRRYVERTPARWLGQAIPMTVSIGVASLSCRPAGREASTLMELADQRLYAAKLTRNCVVSGG